MSRFNTAQHCSSRISKVVHGAATVVTRFITVHPGSSNRHLKPGQWARGLGRGFVGVDLLFIVATIVCGGSVFGPCFDIQYFVSF